MEMKIELKTNIQKMQKLPEAPDRKTGDACAKKKRNPLGKGK